MKIIRDDSTIQLFEKMESLRYQPHESWRALYFKLSDKQLPEQRITGKNFILDSLTGTLPENSFIYTCENGDIYILFQGGLNKIINSFTSHFTYLAPKHLKAWPLDSILFSFDLRKDWELFYHRCEMNYLHALAKTEELRGQFLYVTHAAGGAAQRL